MKKNFGHDLKAAYDALPAETRSLTPDEVSLLGEASSLYAAKVFEYVQPGDAATAFTRFPDLDALGELAAKAVSMAANAGAA